MPDYWLDSDSFITPKNGPYGFDIAPGFWDFIDQKGAEGIICSPILVYHELVDETDDVLAKWARERQTTSLFVEPDEAVQAEFKEIADYVNGRYERSQAGEFLDGADPWVIAHARAGGGEVVTFEVPAPASKRVKIPDVCAYYNIPWTDTYRMLRKLGFSLVQKGSLKAP